MRLFSSFDSSQEQQIPASRVIRSHGNFAVLVPAVFPSQMKWPLDSKMHRMVGFLPSLGESGNEVPALSEISQIDPILT